MAFKLLKDWLFVAGHRRRRSKAGKFVVTAKGQTAVVVRFLPDTISVAFTDPDPPVDPCNPHVPDSCSSNLIYLGYGRYALEISWSVWGCRTIKYELAGYPVVGP